MRGVEALQHTQGGPTRRPRVAGLTTCRAKPLLVRAGVPPYAGCLNQPGAVPGDDSTGDAHADIRPEWTVSALSGQCKEAFLGHSLPEKRRSLHEVYVYGDITTFHAVWTQARTGRLQGGATTRFETPPRQGSCTAAGRAGLWARYPCCTCGSSGLRAHSTRGSIFRGGEGYPPAPPSRGRGGPVPVV